MTWLPDQWCEDASAARARRRAGVRAAVVLLAALAALASLGARRAPRRFGFEDVARKAHRLADKRFQTPRVRVPEWLGKISYDQWRDIRFRPEEALWRDKRRPFRVQFFHPGLYYDHTVRMNVVDGGKVRLLRFSPSQFDYGRNDFASKVPQDLGYAGFRIHAPIKRPDYFDEVIVFLGATYFRAVGKDQVFGTSARALAIDTAAPSGEEFPYFKEFWLVTPTRRAKDVTAYALLDSPSLTGAYQFVVKPGEQTTVEVRARLFLRRQPEKIGIAPLSSMFFHGENSVRQFDDFRPEVHDSDGLLIAQATGEWMWRPLENPRTLEVEKFRMPGLRGYGLVQRDRDFASYQDLETHSEQRPSSWVTPHGDWGAGHVELVQIPTKSSNNDNIAAYWVPDVQPQPGKPYEIGYTIAFYGDDPARPPGGRAMATRRDSGNKENAQRFVIDFAGKNLEAIAADQVVRGDITIAPEDDAAELLDQHVVKNPATGGWRLTFQVRPSGRMPVELRAFLDKGSDTLTETWTYTLLP
jgi:glucans biosynthesis protein